MNFSPFSKAIIQDLTSFKIIKEQLKENHISHIAIEEIENEAFNILINQIEFEKGESRVEIGVIGSFSSGKSTFINSLFGKPISPMAVKPSTSSITKFYYGYQEKITLNGQTITKSEYQESSQHLNGDAKHTETYYIEYAYPLERLKSIILYDTPGFNNNFNDNDTEVTIKALKRVDVIFFIVDISKGAIDKSSMERLQELKSKRMYCILNKSDLKSEQAIEKIKSEIISKRVFVEVIEYSAFKVLEFTEKNYITDHLQHIEEQLIPKKINFNTNIRGEIREGGGRLKNKLEYRLSIDNNEYIIDNFYTTSKQQRIRVEKMLNRISDTKRSMLKQKLKIDRYNYSQKALLVVKKILEKLNLMDNIMPLKRELNNFIKEKESLC